MRADCFDVRLLPNADFDRGKEEYHLNHMTDRSKLHAQSMNTDV